VEGHFLDHALGRLKHQASFLAMQGQGLVPDLTNQEDWLPGRLPDGQGQLIGLHGPFNGLANLLVHAEEPVCRD
jgi:hypothetical protein